ncbi:hypothetical protein ACFX2H_029822 [Malus domestica]
MLRAFVLPSGFEPGGAVEPPAASDADLLVHVVIRHVLLVCATVAEHVVCSMLLAIVFGGGCQWNLSWIALVLSSVHRVAAYFGASHEDFLVSLASCGRFPWNVLGAR